MIFSFNSLSKFIDLSDFTDKQKELSHKLSQSGFEVESWEKKELPHVVVAQVLKKQKHPQADRLSLCQVQSEEDRVHNIVCGATNFEQGDKVVLALPGARLPGDFKIKVSKIRGETSEGMLASLSELNLTAPEEKSEGIFVLPKQAPLGQNFARYIGLEDSLFDIDVTPNRADCLSHLGLARELSCILNRPLKKEALKIPKLKAQGASIKKKLGLEVRQNILCPRYTGRAIYGVKIGPSPLWLKISLENLGFNSINNVVDVTNYFLIQWGQPLHAFDLDLLQNKLLIDYSQKKEKFKTLKDEEIELTGEELCIRDEKQALALAGVIGGSSSGVQANTKDIFLEAACFEPTQVRKSSKRFGIETDSSYRFSRGVPSENTLEMLHRAAALIQEVGGGEISSDEHDIWKKDKAPKLIQILQEDLEERLGMPCSFKKFENWMRGLGCEIKVKRQEASVTIPFFRFDLKIKEDLIEEYARLEGYDKIPEKISYLSRFPMPDQKAPRIFNKIASILAHQGLYQAINHSFISEEFSRAFLGAEKEKNLFQSLPHFLQPKPEASLPVHIQNPLSAEYSMMRVSLSPSLFKNAIQSQKHGQPVGRLFEIGKIFYSINNSPENKKEYKEADRLGFIAWGQEENLWEKGAGRSCIYDLKTILESLLLSLNISSYEWTSEGSVPTSLIHPHQYQILKVKEETLAFIGTLHPLLAEAYKVRGDMALGEMQLESILNLAFKPGSFQQLSPFPAVERDISVLIPKDFPAHKILEGIKKIAGRSCRSVRIFDVYENEQTRKEGQRSVAFRLTLQSDNQTFTEEALKKLQDRLTKDLIAEYPCKLRL